MDELELLTPEDIEWRLAVVTLALSRFSEWPLQPSEVDLIDRVDARQRALGLPTVEETLNADL